MNLYRHTLVPESPWKRLSPSARAMLSKAIVLTHFATLTLGALHSSWWSLSLAAALADTAIVLVMLRFHPLAFPAQVRFAYLLMVLSATFVPALEPLYYLAAFGFAAVLVAGYCPISRLMYLMPWNRTRPLTFRLFVLAHTHPPQPRRFTLDDVVEAPADVANARA